MLCDRCSCQTATDRARPLYPAKLHFSKAVQRLGDVFTACLTGRRCTWQFSTLRDDSIQNRSVATSSPGLPLPRIRAFHSSILHELWIFLRTPSFLDKLYALSVSFTRPQSSTAAGYFPRAQKNLMMVFISQYLPQFHPGAGSPSRALPLSE